jgi:hypothetical protein
MRSSNHHANVRVIHSVGQQQHSNSGAVELVGGSSQTQTVVSWSDYHTPRAAYSLRQQR